MNEMTTIGSGAVTCNLSTRRLPTALAQAGKQISSAIAPPAMARMPRARPSWVHPISTMRSGEGPRRGVDHPPGDRAEAWHHAGLSARLGDTTVE
ncbi:hypothetical protein B5K06_33120 [Rhizobium grahamii]|uniref:Uncharacterized protein n=1 Tax=Rhizobium grahamii TaxID=1120045 RepID=A0A370KEL7_9HYPH|nr:hypothetical protein B5K06_33120 [Rhizobium grahamii]